MDVAAVEWIGAAASGASGVERPPKRTNGRTNITDNDFGGERREERAREESSRGQIAPEGGSWRFEGATPAMQCHSHKQALLAVAMRA